VSGRPPDVVLGLDLGTSAVKAMLLDEAATVRGHAREAYPTHHPAPALTEQDPADWLAATSAAVRACLGAAGPVQVAAIGLSGHMSAPVLTAGDGAALARCHTLTDTRAETNLAADLQTAIEARTGNRCAAYFTLPKLLWWQRHHPDLLARTAAVLAPKDFLRGWLTGSHATDPTDAGNMLLFEPVERRWIPDLARTAGLDPAVLPPLVEPTAIAGHLRPGRAAALGLPAGLPVAAGAADMAAALLGIGLRPDEIAVTIGTSATVIAPVTEIIPALLGRLTFHPGAETGSLFALGSHFNGGASLDWLRGILGGAPALDAAAELARALPPGADGVLFVPYLLGAGSPDFDPVARGGFLGLAASHGPAHLLRAMLEGVGADLCRSIDLLDPSGLRPLLLGGGGARVGPWPQLLADLAQRPVALAAAPDASTLGAALIAGVALGWFGGTLAAASRHVRGAASPLRPATPDPYAAWRPRFLAARHHARAAAAE
jgi:xylulokinase